ncbi:hypothetical protein Pisl_1477 [Pyrobaculum islandicum DSM 4184]|uniref:Uncharacterized protein n=1 Tax=Pyrobaculum islandicum (strain DSM 4184 / JCM 9189 / GEO3) TaxID=384616 RepID=A1RUK1_PYRIL|nr:hypothetical protein [Pyrobaculum islandicum]ABL88633.1 hypothetical protein Pisl_1477 [Pyrobaculum islandicum DSM 4184]
MQVETIERVGLQSLWLLEPRIAELLARLSGRGYITARVRPRALGGYDITFIEPPNVIAYRGSTYVMYDPSRRSLVVEGFSNNEVLAVFHEVEEILRDVGSDPKKGVLLYELQVKALARGNRPTEVVKTSDIIGIDLLAVPMAFVSADGDPNSTRWFHLELRPVWTSWSDEKTYYEVVVIYREKKERLIDALKNIDKILREIIQRIYSSLEINT